MLSGFFQKPRFLKFFWAEITQIGMTPISIVKHFYVINDVSPGFLSGFITCKKDPFGLQTAEKNSLLQHYPKNFLPAHAADYPMGLQHVLEIVAAILVSPVRVKDLARKWPSTPDCHALILFAKVIQLCQHGRATL